MIRTPETNSAASRWESQSPPERPEREDRRGDDDQLLLDNRTAIVDGIFNCSTPRQVEASVCFARYLCHVGINGGNYLLFLRFLETNNKWVVDALVGEREPRLLFSGIRPNHLLVSKAFVLLSAWHPGEIYAKVLQAVLGIIEYCYHSPDDGYRIYRLRITDLNNVGKFLDETKDQFEPCNAQLLSLLDRITRIGAFEDNTRKSVLAKHAFDIRIAYFDNQKRCIDVIPQLLMIRLEREEERRRPSKGFLQFLDTT
jgi:hypothetical protein